MIKLTGGKLTKRFAAAIAELNRAWDELTDIQYQEAAELEAQVLEPLYQFVSTRGMHKPEEL